MCIYYFNTLTRLFGISHDPYVIGKFFHEFKSFSLLPNLIGLIKAKFDALEHDELVKKH